jgi:hypothetical protein
VLSLRASRRRRITVVAPTAVPGHGRHRDHKTFQKDLTIACRHHDCIGNDLNVLTRSEKSPLGRGVRRSHTPRTRTGSTSRIGRPNSGSLPAPACIRRRRRRLTSGSAVGSCRSSDSSRHGTEGSHRPLASTDDRSAKNSPKRGPVGPTREQADFPARCVAVAGVTQGRARRRQNVIPVHQSCAEPRSLATRVARRPA